MLEAWEYLPEEPSQHRGEQHGGEHLVPPQDLLQTAAYQDRCRTAAAFTRGVFALQKALSRVLSPVNCQGALEFSGTNSGNSEN
jgi:hypothetical protein